MLQLVRELIAAALRAAADIVSEPEHDFKWAYQQMMRGLMVRRRHWSADQFMYYRPAEANDGKGFLTLVKGHYMVASWFRVDIKELEATDWEIH